MAVRIFRIASGPVIMSVALAAAILSGCGGAATPTPTEQVITLRLRAVLGSSDLSVGKNRLVLGLLGPTGAPVKASAVALSMSYVQNDSAIHHSDVLAAFRPWPAGPGGVFTAEVDFPSAGTWLLEITPVDGDMEGEMARVAFPVQEQSATPALGAPAPPSQNRTAKDVATLDELTTDAKPDPDLYSMSIAQALKTGHPTLVTFATPAFCTSATCGPQVDVVKEVKNAFANRANFIHVEIYANPKEMRSDLSKGQIAPAVGEWNLPSEPWTFIMDAQGKVAAKFEGFASYEELATALTQLLSP